MTCKCGHTSSIHYAEEYIRPESFACSGWGDGCRCLKFEPQSELDKARTKLTDAKCKE